MPDIHVISLSGKWIIRWHQELLIKVSQSGQRAILLIVDGQFIDNMRLSSDDSPTICPYIA